MQRKRPDKTVSKTRKEGFHILLFLFLPAKKVKNDFTWPGKFKQQSLFMRNSARVEPLMSTGPDGLKPLRPVKTKQVLCRMGYGATK